MMLHRSTDLVIIWLKIYIVTGLIAYLVERTLVSAFNPPVLSRQETVSGEQHRMAQWGLSLGVHSSALIIESYEP